MNVTMSQKLSLIQSARSVQRALMADNNPEEGYRFWAPAEKEASPKIPG
jgi:hypothetical protein